MAGIGFIAGNGIGRSAQVKQRKRAAEAIGRPCMEQVSNDSKRLSICCSASSEVFDPRRAIDRGSRRHRVRRPHASRYLCDDLDRHPRRVHGLVGLRPSHARGLAVSNDALRPRKLRVVTAASSHVRLRLGVRRPRPPSRAESIGRAWALRAYSSRPARSRLLTRPGASLEVSRPLQHTSAASRAHSEGGRPPDLSRSGVLRPPYRPRSRATDLTIGEHFAPAVFRFTSEVIAASLDPVDALGLSAAVPHHLAAPLATRSMTNRTVSTRFPVVFGPSRGCRR
jgi:hypothetical protein